MLAKLIAYGEDRASAIARLLTTLQQSTILGVTTNLSLLAAICQNAAFQTGETHTDFLQTEGLLTLAQEAEPEAEYLCAAAYSDLSLAYPHESKNPWHVQTSWQLSGTTRTLTYSWQDIRYTLQVTPPIGEGAEWLFELPDRTIEKRSCQRRGTTVMLRKGESQRRFLVQRTETETLVSNEGHHYRLARRQPPDVSQATHAKSEGQTHKSLRSPMAGTIVKVHVQDGDEVQAHQPLLVLSAMKMEHAITAPTAGRVQHVYPIEGQVVAGGVTLIEME
jgi:acetyl/propionyl-CoA carboxylase alpha subunit